MYSVCYLLLVEREKKQKNTSSSQRSSLSVVMWAFRASWGMTRNRVRDCVFISTTLLVDKQNDNGGWYDGGTMTDYYLLRPTPRGGWVVWRALFHWPDVGLSAAKRLLQNPLRFFLSPSLPAVFLFNHTKTYLAFCFLFPFCFRIGLSSPKKKPSNNSAEQNKSYSISFTNSDN